MISVAGRSSLDRAEMDREKAAIAAGNQPAEVYRHCPKCGADQFTQRAVR
jgi:hypothetical protein